MNITHENKAVESLGWIGDLNLEAEEKGGIEYSKGFDIGFNDEDGKRISSVDTGKEEDYSSVIIHAYRMLHSGMFPKQIKNSLRERFGEEIVGKCEQKLKPVFAKSGIVGCIAVEPRVFEYPQEAVKYASNSPYRATIKYVIGDVDWESKDSVQTFECEESYDIDSFFASEKVDRVSSKGVRIDSDTNMMVLSSSDDIDDTFLRKCLSRLVVGNVLTEDDANRIYYADENSLQKIKAAFGYADFNRNRKGGKKREEENLSSFLIKSGLELDIGDYEEPVKEDMNVLAVGEVELEDCDYEEQENLGIDPNPYRDASGTMEVEFGNDKELIEVDVNCDFRF